MIETISGNFFLVVPMSYQMNWDGRGLRVTLLLPTREQSGRRVFGSGYTYTSFHEVHFYEQGMGVKIKLNF